MSGPKKSQAQLRREEQERIRKKRQRELEIKKKQEAERLKRELEEKLRKEKITKCQNVLRSYVTKLGLLQKNLNKDIQSYSRNTSSNSTTAFDKANSVNKKVEQFLKLSTNVSNDINSLERSISEAKDIMNMFSGLNATLLNENKSNQVEYIKELNKKLNQLFNRTENFKCSSSDYNKQIAELEAQLYWGELVEKKVSQFISKDISTSLKNEITQKFADLGKTGSFSDIKLFYTNNIPKLENKVEADAKEQKELEERFGSIYSDYALLCEECRIEKLSFPITKESIVNMANEINKMNNYLQNKSEKEAIKKAIDEVMEELGYPVLATRYLSTQEGDCCQKILVQYAEDKAVDVTVTEDGQITMEIGIMDNYARAPTQSETTDLCTAMNNFCDDYKLLEQKLEEKGLVFSDKNFLPPTAAYAEIIDVSEYGLEVEYSEDENISNEVESNNVQTQVNYMQEDL